MISVVDQKAKTFTIAGKEKSRVFKITDKTVVTKAGAPATVKDMVANEEVRG
jgi:20S proteasome alpha/beta subunit